MYSVDPTMLAGLIFPIKEEDKRYLVKGVQGLSVIGSPFGQGQAANIEVLMKAKPDLIIMWSESRSARNEKAEEILKRLNLPFVYVVAENLSDYPDVFLFLGKLLGREERAARLASYSRKTLSEVKTVVSRVAPERRPSVYYAEGFDGLSTECNDSIHVELVQLAGDKNVHRCHTSSHKGFEKVSLEQVMLYNPDVIVAQEKVFYDKVIKGKDPAWQNIKAVKEKRIYLIPRAPLTALTAPLHL
jgi:iron complex transport system substrate-binding protein